MRRTARHYWLASARLLGELPPKPRRKPHEQAAAQLIQDAAREARVRFLPRHADAVYERVVRAAQRVSSRRRCSAHTHAASEHR